MLRPMILVATVGLLFLAGCGKGDAVTKENFGKVKGKVTTGINRPEVETILGPGKDMDKKNMPPWVLPDIFAKLKGEPVTLKNVPPDAMRDFSGDFVMWGDEKKYIMGIFNEGKLGVLWQKGIPGEQ